jgi:signal transduction histidine kinase
MFTSISHELRTPINAIQNSLQYLRPILQQYDQVSVAKQLQPSMYFYEICDTSATFLLSLVNDTLDYGQLSAGSLTFNFEQVNIRELCADVAKLIAV